MGVYVGWPRRFGEIYSLGSPVSRTYVQVKAYPLTALATLFLTHDIYNAFALINSNLQSKVLVFP